MESKVTAAGGGGGEDDLRSPLLRHPLDGDKSGAVEERLGIDDVLLRHAGEFGRWQLRHFVLTSLAWALKAFHTMVMIFADRELAWRCAPSYVGACPTDECKLRPDQWEWAPSGGGGWLPSSPLSTVAEWGLVCGQKYKVGLVHSAFFAGSMLGAPVFGHLSDSFLGRKRTLAVVCILNAVFGLLTAASPSFWVYAGLRFLTGFSNGGVGLCAFVLATEPVGPTKRAVAGISTFYFFSGGIAILSGIAYAFRTWRSLYVASSLPSLLFLAAVLPFVSESPRWYLVRRRIDKAMDVMHAIAKKNRKQIPPRVTLKLDNEEEEEVDEAPSRNGDDNDGGSTVAVSGSIYDVLRNPMTRTRLVLSVAINFSCALIYYGLSLNVVNLNTNLYLSVLLNSVAEMPAYLLIALFINRFGRKPLCVATMWLSGVFCVVGSAVGGVGVMKVVRMVCGMIGIFGITAAYNLMYIYIEELFPTMVRNAALGCASQASQMGAILAPLVVILGGGTPFAVFATFGIAGGFFACYLPETMNRPLYETLAGMEEGESKLC